MKSHYGNEHFCPLTLLRVLGASMAEEYYEDHDDEKNEKQKVEENIIKTSALVKEEVALIYLVFLVAFRPYCLFALPPVQSYNKGCCLPWRGRFCNALRASSLFGALQQDDYDHFIAGLQ